MSGQPCRQPGSGATGKALAWPELGVRRWGDRSKHPPCLVPVWEAVLAWTFSQNGSCVFHTGKRDAGPPARLVRAPVPSLCVSREGGPGGAPERAGAPGEDRGQCHHCAAGAETLSPLRRALGNVSCPSAQPCEQHSEQAPLSWALPGQIPAAQPCFFCSLTPEHLLSPHPPSRPS